MLSIEEMVEKIQNLVSLPKDKMLFVGGEHVSTILETDFLRVLYTCMDSDDALFRIEVELALNKCINPDIFQTFPKDEMKRTIDFLLENAIKHLQYMQHLHNIGFDVCPLQGDSMWTAERQFSTLPSPETIAAILPPSDLPRTI